MIFAGFFVLLFLGILTEVGFVTGIVVFAAGVLSLVSLGSIGYLILLYIAGEEYPRQVVIFASCLPIFFIFMFVAERREYFVSRLKNLPIYVYVFLIIPLVYYAHWQYASREIAQYNQALWEVVRPTYACFTYESEMITPIQSAKRATLTTGCQWAQERVDKRLQEMGPIEQMPTSNGITLALLAVLLGGIATALGGIFERFKPTAVSK